MQYKVHTRDELGSVYTSTPLELPTSSSFMKMSPRSIAK